MKGQFRMKDIIQFIGNLKDVSFLESASAVQVAMAEKRIRSLF